VDIPGKPEANPYPESKGSSGCQHKKSGMNQIEAVKEVFPHAQPDLL
jgi:hypothetical protein